MFHLILKTEALAVAIDHVFSKQLLFAKPLDYGIAVGLNQLMSGKSSVFVLSDIYNPRRINHIYFKKKYL